MKKSTLWLAGVFGVVCAILFLQSAVEAGDSDYKDWLTDLPKAIAKAKAEHKYVFVDFTGSDWCPACIQLHKKVLATKEFQNFADTNLVLVLVDFPEKKKLSDALKKANDALKDKYSIEGFPTLFLLDGDGQTVDKMLGYGGEKPADFIARLKSHMAKS